MPCQANGPQGRGEIMQVNGCLQIELISASDPGFPEPEPEFLAIFYHPKPVFFQLLNPGILKNLELPLHSNISNSDNTEVADWAVTAT